MQQTTADADGQVAPTERPADGGGSGARDGGVSTGSPDASYGYGIVAPLTEVEACRRYVAYSCERRFSCGLGLGQYASGCFDNAQYCPDMMFGTGSTRTIDNVIACAEAWLDLPCEDVAHDRAPACGATRGTRASGESCLFTTQCQSARCTANLSGGTCGRCVDEAPAGGACGASTVCRRDETCTDGMCVPHALYPAVEPSQFYAPGQVCMYVSSNYGGCSLDTRCHPGARTQDDLRCRYRPGPGEPCSAGYLGLCWGNGACLMDRTCAPVFACPANGPRTCPPGNICVCADAECTRQSCDGLRQAGASCAPPIMPCAERLECVQGICQPANLPGRFETVCPP
jgi:hypothetical protein